MSAVFAVVALHAGLCAVWYYLGRMAGYRKWRETSGWWDGFQHGCNMQVRAIQAEMLEQGLVMVIREQPRPKDN